MRLDVLPTRHGSAAENMAIDFLLLQRYPEAHHARFRHYGWQRPAFTFGYSQKLGWVRSQLPGEEPFELCRRPTGGGIVDHRADWTYALVVPRGHSAYDVRAIESYRIVHQAIADALKALGQPAELKPVEEAPEADAPAGVCFQRAEVFDVVNPTTEEKIAGAAQKRTKHGLLFQGSLSRQSVLPTLDWDVFGTDLVNRLSQALQLSTTQTPWPEIAEDEIEGLTGNYSAPEWNELR